MIIVISNIFSVHMFLLAKVRSHVDLSTFCHRSKLVIKGTHTPVGGIAMTDQSMACLIDSPTLNWFPRRKQLQSREGRLLRDRKQIFLRKCKITSVRLIVFVLFPHLELPALGSFAVSRVHPLSLPRYLQLDLCRAWVSVLHSPLPRCVEFCELALRYFPPGEARAK